MLIAGIVALLAVLGTAQVTPSIIGVDATSPSQTPLRLDRYTGVAYLEPAECTGALLKGGWHVLTAAHCLNEGGVEVEPDTLTAATFKLPSGDVSIPIADYFIHPGWTGYESEVGNDIAVLKLTKKAPINIERYDIYRRSDEIGKVFIKIGYGYIGVGEKGQEEASNAEAKRYAGQNKYEALIDIFKDTSNNRFDFSELASGSQLIFDFDNGEVENDALGRHFPKLADTGLGMNEIASGSGDSGGPSFINGKIAGITSWGCGDGEIFSKRKSDIDSDSFNGSFGEFSSDTRVSHYADWIDSVTRGDASSD